MAQLNKLAKNKGMIVTCILLAAYVLYWWLYSSRVLNALFLLATVPLTIFMVLFSFDKIKAPEDHVFLFLLIAMGILFCFAFPPMKVPDEPYHYISNHWIVNAITGNGTLASSDVSLSADDWEFFSRFNSAYLSSEDYLDVVKNFSLFSAGGASHVVAGYSFSVGAVNPSARIFTIVALLIAKGLNLGAYPSFYLGRLFSLGSFVAAAYISYKTAPKGKSIIVFVSLLPMTLHLAASYSYDCGIIAYSLLIFAFLMKAFFGEDGCIGGREVTIFCVVSVLLAPCKVIYSCICLLGLVVPAAKFANKRISYISKGALCAVIAVSVAVFRLSSMVELSEGSAISYRGEETGHFYTLSAIILHPVHSFKMLMNTFDTMGDFYWGSMLGNSLGWFQEELVMPYFFMVPYLGLGALCCFGEEGCEEDAYLSRPLAVCFVAAFVLIAGGAFLSMWTGWTFDTENVIMGVQGRYLLPALPVLLIPLRSRRFAYKGGVLKTVLCGMGLMNCIFLIRLLGIATSL